MGASDLTGQVVAITGANRGIGRELARGLAASGAQVALVVRDAVAGAETADAIEAEVGARPTVATADVRDPEAMTAAADAVVRAHGRVDSLVNNAGICHHQAALEVSLPDWDDVIGTNLTGTWLGCQAFGRHMVAQGHGSIVNVGSMSGQIVNRPQWQPAYNASKAAVHHLTRSLAVEWAESGVRVNAVAPGYVATAMSPVDDPAFRRRWIDDAPMKRAARPDELVGAVRFLLGEHASFVTGEVLVLDGGYTLV